jgi:AP-2 complex subunit mu-1
MDSTSFIYTRHKNLYLVAVTRSNSNAGKPSWNSLLGSLLRLTGWGVGGRTALAFEYLFQKIRILKAYLGDDFDEVSEERASLFHRVPHSCRWPLPSWLFDQNSIRSHFTLVYELFDGERFSKWTECRCSCFSSCAHRAWVLPETMDFGYPQNTSVDVLRLYINLGDLQQNEDQPRDAAQLTSQITGAIDWRREGIRYRKNEVYIDVLESVNLLLSANGTVLRNDVTGQVIMKSMLSGMPECKFGLNDKLIMDREGNRPQQRGGRKPITAVEIDDCTFHRCVRLGKFDAERTITFVPPDGEFELMRYRVKEGIVLPFRVLPSIQEEGRNRLSVNIKLIANYNSRVTASNVVVKIPVRSPLSLIEPPNRVSHLFVVRVRQTPPNTATAKVRAARGRARFEPEQKAIVWRLRNYTGGAETFLSAEVEMVASMKDKTWNRPPISLEFQVPLFTASGVQVRFLKVYDKSGYTATRWVRYVTRQGDYEVRI